MKYSNDDLNFLFDAALEFGENWRKPLIEWARELWPAWDDNTQIEISRYIETVRDSIENYISERYDHKKEQLTVSAEEVKGWIKQNYPWMNADNIIHAYSQGMYYAWHG